MADMKECAKYAHCDWRKSVGYCPDECNHFKHKDEVIVVRCKNCKHCQYDAEDRYFACTNSSAFNDIVEPNEFCSYGERKDNERKAD